MAGTWVGGNTISAGRRRREPREELSFLVDSLVPLESVRPEIGIHNWESRDILFLSGALSTALENTSEMS